MGRQPRFRDSREQVFEFVVEFVVGHGGQTLARPGNFLAAPQVLLDGFDHGASRMVLGRRRRRRGPGERLLVLLRRQSRLRRPRHRHRLRGRRVREHPNPVTLSVDGPAPISAVTPHRRHGRRVARVRGRGPLWFPRMTRRRRLLRLCRRRVVVRPIAVLSRRVVIVVVVVRFPFRFPFFRGRGGQRARPTAAEPRARRRPARHPEQRQAGVAHGQSQQIEHVVQQRLLHLIVHVAIVAQCGAQVHLKRNAGG